MQTYQKFSCLLIFLITVTLGKSQNLIYGATISSGPSVVTSNEPTDGTFKTKAAFSGNLGVFLEKKLGRHYAIGIEALWVQMEGYEVIENIEFYQSYGEDFRKIGFITEEYKFHTSYFGLPIYFRYEFGKLGIKASIQSLFLITTSTYFRSYGELYDVPFDSGGKWRPLELSDIDSGTKLGIDYAISPNLRLRMDFYHGLRDIAVGRFDRERKNRQLGIGVNYIFGKREDVYVE